MACVSGIVCVCMCMFACRLAYPSYPECSEGEIKLVYRKICTCGGKWNGSVCLIKDMHNAHLQIFGHETDCKY